MGEKEYYHERQGMRKRLNFDHLKKLFLSLLQHKFYNEDRLNYLSYAKLEVWKPTPESYILIHLGLDHVWPIEQRISSYSRVTTIFTIIEFLFDHVVDPNHIRDDWDNVQRIEEARQMAREEYANEVNQILRDYGPGYRLSQSGEIQQLAQEGFDHLIQEIPITSEDENVDGKVHSAIGKFFRYNSSLEEKKEAIRTLADVMEYLRDCGIRLDTKDESDLFHIFNRFGIRHHNKSQKVEYVSDDFYKLTFFVLLANVRFLMIRIVDR